MSARDVLVQQLRAMYPNEPCGHWPRLAADEIERLRAENAVLLENHGKAGYFVEGRLPLPDIAADSISDSPAWTVGLASMEPCLPPTGEVSDGQNGGTT